MSPALKMQFTLAIAKLGGNKPWDNFATLTNKIREAVPVPGCWVHSVHGRFFATKLIFLSPVTSADVEKVIMSLRNEKAAIICILFSWVHSVHGRFFATKLIFLSPVTSADVEKVIMSLRNKKAAIICILFSL